jgi:cholesterol oxidase
VSVQRKRYDAIVVGSGFGGGVSACRLSEAGWRVCVLERGRRFSPGDFHDGLEHAPHLLWHPTVNPHGIYDLRLFRDGAVLTAAGVGGGSLVYANVQLSASRETFCDGWPEAVDREALDPYYARAEDALDPRPVPDPVPAKVDAFAALARHVGREAQRTPLAVHFGEDRVNPFGGAPQQGCTNLGQCLTGCPRHAKNTIDLTYLGRAERHGADVRPLHEVTRLEPPRRAGGRWTVCYRDLDAPADGTLEAPVVILAAGTLGSTRVLLHNRRRLPRLSPALGTRFSANGNALGVIFDPHASGTSDVQVTTGPTITSKLDYWHDRGFVIEDGGVSDGQVRLLEALRGATVMNGWRRHLLRAKTAATRIGLTDQSATPGMVQAKANGHHPTDAFAFLFIGRDSSNGTLRLGRLGRLEMSLDPDDTRLLFDRMGETLDEIGLAVEGQPTFSLDNGPFGRFLIGHPLGGCAMADSPASGVVDQHGRVFGYQDGLRVLDGAIVPTALGVNPSKTITALAERGIEQLIDQGR